MLLFPHSTTQRLPIATTDENTAGPPRPNHCHFASRSLSFHSFTTQYLPRINEGNIAAGPSALRPSMHPHSHHRLSSWSILSSSRPDCTQFPANKTGPRTECFCTDQLAIDLLQICKQHCYLPHEFVPSFDQRKW